MELKEAMAIAKSTGKTLVVGPQDIQSREPIPAETPVVDPGFWSIPNAFMKKVRKMSVTELRDKVHILARSLMDQHNANIVLSERLKTQSEELKNLRILINKASDSEPQSEGL